MPFLPIFSFQRDPEKGVKQAANPPPPDPGTRPRDIDSKTSFEPTT